MNAWQEDPIVAVEGERDGVVDDLDQIVAVGVTPEIELERGPDLAQRLPARWARGPAEQDDVLLILLDPRGLRLLVPVSPNPDVQMIEAGWLTGDVKRPLGHGSRRVEQAGGRRARTGSYQPGPLGARMGSHTLGKCPGKDQNEYVFRNGLWPVLRPASASQGSAST